MGNPSKLDPTFDNRCGTVAGYARHYRKGENYCQPCWNAKKIASAQNYQKNLIENRNKRRQYNADNFAKLKIYWAERYQANRNKINEINKERMRNNPELGRQSARKRRAKIKNNGFERYSEQEVLLKYGSHCYICSKPIDLMAKRRVGQDGWQNALHIEHLIPIALGGADILENVRPAHALCNLQKGHKSVFLASKA